MKHVKQQRHPTQTTSDARQQVFQNRHLTQLIYTYCTVRDNAQHSRVNQHWKLCLDQRLQIKKVWQTPIVRWFLMLRATKRNAHFKRVHVEPYSQRVIDAEMV